MPDIEGVFLTDSETRALAATFLRLASQSNATTCWTGSDWSEFGITREQMVRISPEELAVIQRAVNQFRERRFEKFLDQRLREPEVFLP